VTARDRQRRERNEKVQNPALPSGGRASAVAGHTDVWLARNLPSGKPGVVWLKRPMPDGQWPVNQRKPRDDSFSWWVRSHCGHEARQWAFYREADADLYGGLFRQNPCWYTRCPEFLMIENKGR